MLSVHRVAVPKIELQMSLLRRIPACLFSYLSHLGYILQSS